MADRSSSFESSRMSADEAGVVATTCEAMQLWEGWSNGSSADEASTTLSQLPELAASSRQCHQPDMMLSSLLSHFHPLAHSDDQSGPGGGAFVFQPEPAESEATVSFNGMARNHVHFQGPCDLMSQLNLHSKSPPLQNMWQTSSLPGPESPSSPLALHRWDHGHHAPWPGATSSATIQLLHDAMADSSHSEQAESSLSKKLELFSCTDHRQQSFHGTDHHAARILVPAAHTDSIHIHNNFEAPPSHVWTSAASPEAYSGSRASTRSQQLTNFVRIAQEQRSVDKFCSDPDNSVHTVRSYGEYPQLGKSPARSKSGKQVSEAELTGPPPKRPHLQAVEHGAALWRSAHGHRSLYPPSTTSQAMEIFALGPALNTNGKPRARRGSATDPQSVYARHRREKINERLKTLQHLIPNGAKVDIVTMLDEAVHYVQFLQLQVKLLKSDKYWIHATPNSYKGIDLTCPPGTQGLGSSA